MGRRILVVDDELDIRMVLEEILKGQGFEVFTAENGAEALRKLEQESYDLMVLDIMMPVMDGNEVMAKLPEEVKEKMPVIMLTAKASDEDVMDGYKKGADYYIVKPFDNVTLINAILYLLKEVPEEDIIDSEAKL